MIYPQRRGHLFTCRISDPSFAEIEFSFTRIKGSRRASRKKNFTETEIFGTGKIQVGPFNLELGTTVPSGGFPRSAAVALFYNHVITYSSLYVALFS